MYISTEGQQGRTIIARLKPGQDLVEGINNILKEKNIKAGYIPVLQGGFKNLKLISMTPNSECPDAPRSIETDYAEPLEYFGCGTIAEDTDGNPSIHIHLSAAQTGSKTVSGHLVSGEIALLTEIVIIEIINVKILRKSDPEVFDYKLLSFEK